MRKANWDDFRFVLAVAEEGSVGAAARRLGVNHATVLRRIAAFETCHGVEIFARTAGGYSVRPERLAVIEALREAARAAEGVAQSIERAAGASRLRVTSTDSLCVTVLPRALARVRAALPDVALDLAASNAWLDLGRLDADVTVRPAEALPSDLDGVAAGRLGFAVFRPRDAAGDGWLALKGVLSRSLPGKRMAQLANGESQVASGADSFVILREMVAEGQGRCFLPVVLGDPDPRLRRDDTVPPLSVPLWVAIHGELAGSERLVDLRDRLVAALADDVDRLSGGISG